jgi:hypothetical protein
MKSKEMKAKKHSPIPPALPDPTGSTGSGSVIDDEEWDLFLLPSTLRGDPEAAHDIARLLTRLDQVLDHPKGRKLLRATFRAGVRKAFSYSTLYGERFDLYEWYVAGTLKPEDEPKRYEILNPIWRAVPASVGQSPKSPLSGKRKLISVGSYRSFPPAGPDRSFEIPQLDRSI